MPQRHSKNNNDRGHFTYEERRKLGFGTQKERVGKDSIKPFDSCCLCLQPAVDPLCCRRGHLFCKECIYACLLAQKKDIKRKQVVYDAQQKKEHAELNEKLQAAREKELADFERQNSSATPASDAEARRKLEELENQKGFHGANSVKTTAFEEEAVRTMRAYWLPSATPQAEAKVEAPSTDTLCPAGSHEKLRLKDLLPVVFTELPGVAEKREGSGGSLVVQARGSGDESFSGQYMCPSCTTTLTNATKLSVVAVCGHVLCRKCVERFVLPERACCSCGKRVDAAAANGKRAGGVVELEHGATGYAAHGDTLVVEDFKHLGSGPSAGPPRKATKL